MFIHLIIHPEEQDSHEVARSQNNAIMKALIQVVSSSESEDDQLQSS